MSVPALFIRRPVMTTLVMLAILLFGLGAGGEARRPLGLAVVGGLMVSNC